MSPTQGSGLMTRSALKLAQIAIICTGITLALPSWAAMVTTNESGIDAIFSALVFGDEKIDMRFDSVVNHIDGTLQNISENAPDSLLSAPSDPNNAYNVLRSYYNWIPANFVRMFFIDDINWCGTNGTYAGCAEVGGNDIFIASGFADTSYGDVLNAHELRHNLGLSHDGSANNLMNSTVTNDNNTILLSSQVTEILGSPLVQIDGSDLRYINIVPILVSASAVAVPIPGALILCFSALGSLGFFSGGRRRQTA